MTLSIKHSALSIQHSAFNIQHSALLSPIRLIFLALDVRAAELHELQNAVAAGLAFLQDDALRRLAVEMAFERIEDGIEHFIALDTDFMRFASSVPEAVAAVEHAVDGAGEMEADGELVAVTKTVPVISASIPESCAVAVVIPAAGIERMEVAE